MSDNKELVDKISEEFPYLRPSQLFRVVMSDQLEMLRIVKDHERRIMQKREIDSLMMLFKINGVECCEDIYQTVENHADILLRIYERLQDKQKILESKIELIPNCSEMVCRIDVSQLCLLKKNGYLIVGKKDLKDSWNSDLYLTTPSGEKIRFIEQDDLANSDVIMCGDHDTEYYPILKEVSELIGEEIMGHDGGGTYYYEEWLEEQEKKAGKRKLIPNCSEYVGRIALTSAEVVRLRAVLKLMSNRQRSLSDSNDLFCWDYFEEYLTGTEGNLVFMGEEEKAAIAEALKLIGKSGVDE